MDIQETTEWAFYGELSYRITDSWDVTVGARYYDYEFNVASAVDFPYVRTVFGGEDPDSIVLDFETDKQEDDGTLFKFNTSYDLSDDAMVYFTYSEGYRIGAGNGIAPCPDFVDPDTQLSCALPNELSYQPDETQNYEIGWRTLWMDQALMFNVAIYYIDWTDPQLASTTENASLPITVNGSGARSQGMEMSFNWLINDNWSLRGSYAYTDAELTDDAPDLLSTVEPPGFRTSTIRVDGEDGDRLPGSPEHQGNIYANFYTGIGAMDLNVSYGITAISDVLTKTGARANGEALSGYAVHNLAAALSSDTWTVTFYADNLLDKYAVTGVRSDTAYLQVVSDINGDPVTPRRYSQNVLRPRVIGLRATYRFDL